MNAISRKKVSGNTWSSLYVSLAIIMGAYYLFGYHYSMACILMISLLLMLFGIGVFFIVLLRVVTDGSDDGYSQRYEMNEARAFFCGGWVMCAGVLFFAFDSFYPPLLMDWTELFWGSAYFWKYFLLGRFVLCFVLMRWLMSRFMKKCDKCIEEKVADGEKNRKLRGGAAFSLVILFVVVSVLAVDLVMARHDYWPSDLFPVYLLLIAGVLGAANRVLNRVVRCWKKDRKEEDLKHLVDACNLLLMFVLLRGYAAYVMELVSWYGQKTGWRNMADSSQSFSMTVIFSFGLPLLALLFTKIKRMPGFMCVLCLSVFLGCVLEGMGWMSRFYFAEDSAWRGLAAALVSWAGVSWCCYGARKAKRKEEGNV